MKRTFGHAALLSSLVGAALAFSIQAAAADTSWYVSPTGDDEANGTLEHPFATVQRAQQSAAPGDTVFLRGGTYCMKEAQIARRKSVFAWVIDLDKSGTQGKPITYCEYKKEKPVFDFSQVKPAGMRVTAFHVSGSWLHLRGIDVTGVQVTIKQHTQSICFENTGSHNVYEQLTMHDGQAIGVYCIGGSDNLFLNCDAWNNWDYTSEDGKGGNVDGFGCHPRKGDTGNVFRGCRAWFNSDDGYDCIRAFEPVTFENCWAFYNGLSPELQRRGDGNSPKSQRLGDGKGFSPKLRRLGDGNGFKAGGYGKNPAREMPGNVPRHTIRFCLAVGNKANGFYANHHPDGCDWFNNSAYHNGGNFNMLAWDAQRQTDIDGHGHKLRNNLSYHCRTPISHLDSARSDSANNSFDLGITLSDQDFASLDENELLLPRKPNGDLPDIRFLHPVKNSPLIGRGVKLGLPFTGEAPDLGAFGCETAQQPPSSRSGASQPTRP